VIYQRSSAPSTAGAITVSILRVGAQTLGRINWPDGFRPPPAASMMASDLTPVMQTLALAEHLQRRLALAKVVVHCDPVTMWEPSWGGLGSLMN
jgi:hypothetical protein